MDQKNGQANGEGGDLGVIPFPARAGEVIPPRTTRAVLDLSYLALQKQVKVMYDLDDGACTQAHALTISVGSAQTARLVEGIFKAGATDSAAQIVERRSLASRLRQVRGEPADEGESLEQQALDAEARAARARANSARRNAGC